MKLEYKKYSQVYDRFLMRFIQTGESQLAEYQQVLEEICDMLCVSRIEHILYSTPKHEALHQGENTVLYEKPKTDGSQKYVYRSMTDKGNVEVCIFYQFIGDDAWNQEFCEKLQTLASTIFVVSGRAKMAKLLDDYAFYNQDLKLPNLGFFKRTIAPMVAKKQMNGYVSCFFNLRRYSMVNDRLGRDLGTRVMSMYAKNLQKKLGEDGLVCHVGGDNFMVLFRRKHTEMVVDYLQGAYVQYSGKQQDRVLIASLAGYYVIGENVDEVEDIIQQAHVAYQTVRESVGKAYLFYDEQIKQHREYINNIEEQFREAIDKEEFLVYYQPKVMLRNYRLAGAEALCRWMHDGQLVPPNDFIPILEQSVMICELDYYMLEHVCRDIRRWIDEGKTIVPVSVNLSRRHMGDPDLLGKLVEIIDKYSVPHQYIEIELTETTTDVGFRDLKTVVYGLHEAGIHTSVDDFGVGYSSLNLIRQVPWDVIKIDKSFLPDHIEPNSVQYVMLCHLFSMLQEMGYKCIVEGVETVEQVKMLKANNCYLAQGYHFDKPLEVCEFEKRLLALESKR